MSEAVAVTRSLEPHRPAAGSSILQQGAAAVHSILGTPVPLSQIKQVRMHVLGPCKMGISFWPMFSFSPPQREEKPGSANVIKAVDAPANMVIPTASSNSDNPSNSGADCTSSTPLALDTTPAETKAAHLDNQLLHVNFTQSPPDEFTVGAKFMGGIPFPFISIRTTRLEGTIDPGTGAVVLLFEAQFLATMGKREPTVLTINAQLTSEKATAFKTSLQGKRLKEGYVTLVSAAEVPKTSSWFANLILWLPTAATSVLPMRLEFLE